MEKLRIALIGQSEFAAEVYSRVIADGHDVVGVFTIPDNKDTGEEDSIATLAKHDNVCVFKYKSWRRKGVVKPDVFEQYKSISANLNVMPYCTQFIPIEVINYPKNDQIQEHLLSPVDFTPASRSFRR